MLAYRDKNGNWIAWNIRDMRPMNGGDLYQIPPEAEMVYSVEELTIWGLARVVPIVTPEGKRIVSTSLIDNNGVPTETAIFEDIPAPTPEPYIIPKDLIWRRATDAEAEAMEHALNTQPVRLQRIYDGAIELQTDDELFAMLQAAIVALFGADRAAELLAPQ